MKERSRWLGFVVFFYNTSPRGVLAQFAGANSYLRPWAALRLTMGSCKKEMVDVVMDSSEECVNSDEEQDEKKEWDDLSDKDSVASSDSAVEEMSIDDLETLLDE